MFEDGYLEVEISPTGSVREVARNGNKRDTNRFVGPVT